MVDKNRLYLSDLELCGKCGTRYYRGEPCPVCYHAGIERKATQANAKARQCSKCGYKFNYLVVCNPFTVKLKPECGCFAFQEMKGKSKAKNAY